MTGEILKDIDENKDIVVSIKEITDFLNGKNTKFPPNKDNIKKLANEIDSHLVGQKREYVIHKECLEGAYLKIIQKIKNNDILEKKDIQLLKLCLYLLWWKRNISFEWKENYMDDVEISTVIKTTNPIYNNKSSNINNKPKTPIVIDKKLEDKKPNIRWGWETLYTDIVNILNRAEKEYPHEYSNVVFNKRKEHSQKEMWEYNDSIRYDVFVRAIKKYVQELEKESEEIEKKNNQLLKDSWFYEKGYVKNINNQEESVEVYWGWEFFACTQFFDFLQNNKYASYEADQELLYNYNAQVNDLFRLAWYNTSKKFVEDELIYKKYLKEIDEDNDIKKYKKSLLFLSKNPVPKDKDSVVEYIEHTSNVLDYESKSEDISKKNQDMRKKYGVESIERYEKVIKWVNNIQKEYPNLVDVMKRLWEYNVALEGKKKGLKITDESVAKYIKYIEKTKKSWIIEQQKSLSIKYEKLQNIEKNIQQVFTTAQKEKSFIFPEIQKKILLRNESQARTDKIRDNIKDFYPEAYTLANFVVGVWNWLSDAIIGAWTWLWLLIMSAWKDEHELMAQKDRAEQWTNFLKIGQSSLQTEPPVKDGKWNLNFDNATAQLWWQVINMLILLSGAWSIWRWVSQLGAKIWINIAQQVSHRVWLFSYAMMTQLWSSFGEWLREWLTKWEARNYALIQSVVSSSLEMIAPNQMFFGTANIGRVIKQLTTPQAKNLLIKWFIKNISKEMWEEILQESIQLIAERGINSITNQMYDTMFEDSVTLADLTTTAVLTWLTTWMVSSKWSYDMAKTQVSRSDTKKRIVSDNARYNDYKIKLNNIIEGKIDIWVSATQAQELLKELEVIYLIDKIMQEVEVSKAKKEVEVRVKTELNDIVDYHSVSEWDNVTIQNRKLIECYNNMFEYNQEYYDNAKALEEFLSIFEKVKKIFGNEVDLKLVNDGDMNAYYIKNSNTIYIHMLLIKEIANILKKQWKELNESHIAWLLAHEMAHTKQTNANRTKKTEYEADLKWMKAMSKAWFNPWWMVEVLRALEILTSQDWQKNINQRYSLIDVHPYLPERADQLEKLLDNDDYEIEWRTKTSKNIDSPFDDVVNTIEEGKSKEYYMDLVQNTDSPNVLLKIYRIVINRWNTYENEIKTKIKEKISSKYWDTPEVKKIILAFTFNEIENYGKIWGEISKIDNESLLNLFDYMVNVPILDGNHETFFEYVVYTLCARWSDIFIKTMNKIVKVYSSEIDTYQGFRNIKNVMDKIPYSEIGYGESMMILANFFEIWLMKWNNEKLEKIMGWIFANKYWINTEFQDISWMLIKTVEDVLSSPEKYGIGRGEAEFNAFKNYILYDNIIDKNTTLQDIIKKVEEIYKDKKEIWEKIIKILNEKYGIKFDVENIEKEFYIIEKSNFSSEFKIKFWTELISFLLKNSRHELNKRSDIERKKIIEKYIVILNNVTDWYPLCYNRWEISNSVLIEEFFKENPSEEEFLISLQSAKWKILLEFDKNCPYLPKDIRDNLNYLPSRTSLGIVKAVLEYYQSFDTKHFERKVDSWREKLPDVPVKRPESLEEFRNLLKEKKINRANEVEYMIEEWYQYYLDNYEAYSLWYRDNVQVNLSDPRCALFYEFIQKYGNSMLQNADSKSGVEKIFWLGINNFTDAEIHKHFVKYISELTGVTFNKKDIKLNAESVPYTEKSWLEYKKEGYLYEVYDIDMKEVFKQLKNKPELLEKVKDYYLYIKDHISEKQRIHYQKLFYQLEKEISPSTFEDFDKFYMYIQTYINDYSLFRDDVLKDYYNQNNISKDQRNAIDELLFYNTVSNTDMANDVDNSESMNNLYLMSENASYFEKSEFLSFLITGDVKYLPTKMIIKWYKWNFNYKTLFEDFSNLSKSEKKEFLKKLLIQEKWVLHDIEHGYIYDQKQIMFFIKEQIANLQNKKRDRNIEEQIENIDKNLNNIDEMMQDTFSLVQITEYLNMWLSNQDFHDIIVGGKKSSKYNEIKSKIIDNLQKRKAEFEVKLKNDTNAYRTQELTQEMRDMEEHMKSGSAKDFPYTRLNKFLNTDKSKIEWDFMKGIKKQVDQIAGYNLFIKNFVDKVTESYTDKRTKKILSTVITTLLQEHRDYKKLAIIMSLLEVMWSWNNSEQIVKIFEACGAVGVKTWQILADQKDIITNEELRNALNNLKSNASTLDKGALFEMSDRLEKVKIKTIWKKMWSASIKQVHMVTTVDGKEYVAKFLRPTLHQNLPEDIRILKIIVKNLNAIWENVKDITNNIEEIIKEEADFSIESSNQELFIKDVDWKIIHWYTIYIPKIIDANKNVIVEERASGVALKDMKDIEIPQNMYEAIVELYFYQLLKKNNFHADLHAGNVFYDAETKTITLIDNGLIGNSSQDKIEYMRFFQNIEKGRSQHAINQINTKFLEKWSKLSVEEEWELRNILWDKNMSFTDKFKKISRILYGENKTVNHNFNIFLKSLASVGPYIEKIWPEKVVGYITKYLSRNEQAQLMSVSGTISAVGEKLKTRK